MNQFSIVTHSGVFHADEVFACAILWMLFGFDTTIVRTRDREILEEALKTPKVWVVDVGGVYDPEIDNYDHHQREFSELRPEGWKYSSAGLIWRHFGHSLCHTNEIWETIDQGIISQIDRIDNGVGFKTDEKLFLVGDLISSFNTCWHENYLEQDDQFQKAVRVAYEYLKRLIENENGKSLAVEVVREAVQASPMVELVVLEKFVPWQEVMNEFKEPLFVVYPAMTGTNWMVQAIPVEPGSFKNRKPLPKEWWGLRDEELAAEANLPGAVFCHANGFIGGMSTKEGAVKMAARAIAA